MNANFLFAQNIQEKTVVTTGTGATEKEAVQDALVSAIGQVRGMAIKSNETMSTHDVVFNNTEK